MSGGCGREDGGWRQTYHIHSSMSVAILCGKMVKERNRNVSGVMRRQRKSEFVTAEMFASLKAAMGMLAADGDELPYVKVGIIC